MKFNRMLMLSAALALPLCASAQVSPEKRAEIDNLLRLTGMEKLMGQIKLQMINNFKTSYPKVPAEFWNRVSTEMDENGIIEKIIPIYDKYYTLEDLRAVNAFYASPAGQKILSTLPQVTRESMQVGREWGKGIAQKVLDGMAAEAQAAKKAQADQAQGGAPKADAVPAATRQQP